MELKKRVGMATGMTQVGLKQAFIQKQGLASGAPEQDATENRCQLTASPKSSSLSHSWSETPQFTQAADHTTLAAKSSALETFSKSRTLSNAIACRSDQEPAF